MKKPLLYAFTIILLAPLAFYGNALGQVSGGKAGWVAEKVSRLFVAFESHIAKTDRKNIYLTTPHQGSFHKGALVRIVNPNGVNTGYALISDLSKNFATAKLLGSKNKIVPGKTMALGARTPVRVLWISGPGTTAQSSELISDIEERAREKGKLELAPADVGEYLLGKSKSNTPKSISSQTLAEGAEATMSDFIVLLYLDDKSSPNTIVVNVLDNRAQPILTIKEPWKPAAKKSGK